MESCRIRPISDLRNNFAEISKIVHESHEPVFLTNNGYGDMVVMSIEQYENIQNDNEIYMKLRDAQFESDSSNIRHSHTEVFNELWKQLSKRK